MLSSGRMKFCASLLIIVIVFINIASLEARRISGGRSSGGRTGGRTGGISRPASTPIYRAPVYHPPVQHPRPHVPSTIPHTPSVSHTPHTSHNPGSTNGKHASDVLIKSEGGGAPRPGSSGNDHRQQFPPHQPTAPVHDSASRTTVGNQNSANTGSQYPPWANPSANPHAPLPSNPQPSQPRVPYPNAGKPPGPMPSSPYNPSFPNAGKPPGPLNSSPYNPSFPNAGKPPGSMPSAPYPPIHPPGPISHQPINPSHQTPLNSGVPHGMPMPHQPPYPNSYGPPPPYQPPPPYPGSHPPGMPMPSPPHIGFGNGGQTNVPHPPIGNPHHYPSIGNTPSGGTPPHTVINNHYHSSSPPIGSPQNPAGHPMSVHHPPVYGSPQMSQPFVPGQTVLVLPNQQPQSSGPGFGQILKEALVFSTVNAGVNRLINGAPHHHYHDNYQPAPASTGTTSTSTTTNTVIYNQYGNPIPGTNGNPIQGMPQTGQPSIPPGSPPTFPAGQPMGSSSYPTGSGGGYPTVGNPGIASPNSGAPSYGGNLNPNVGTPSYGGNSYPSPTATGTWNAPQSTNIPATNTQQNGNGLASNTTNNQTAAYPVQTYQYFISDYELGNLTESLFAKDEVDALKYINVDLQNRTTNPNATDHSKGPLLYVRPEAYNIPTIQALRSLFDNYEFDSEKKEVTSREKREEENMMLDVFLNTNIMNTAMKWLSNKTYIEPDDFEWKDTLRHIWFSKVNSATSGFERIFLAEKYPGPSILGAQNWIYFDYQESLRRINYLSYVEETGLGGKAALVKVNFKFDDVVKPNTTMLVGTPPELEMALYTICYYARPNDVCPISLGGKRLNIYTHSFRYFHKDLIDLGLVLF